MAKRRARAGCDNAREARLPGRRAALRPAAAGLAVLVSACGGDGPLDPGPASTAPPASALVVAGGDAQTAVAGHPVPTAPRVRVTNLSGAGVPGVLVNFDVIAGGGAVARPRIRTDGQGYASSGGWTLGEQPGPQGLRAEAEGLGAVTFTAFAAPPHVASITVIRGDAQTAAVGSPVGTRPAVVVRDSAGNPVAGVAVTFIVTGGEGRVTGENVTTDAAGEAEVGSWTLGTTAGENQLLASVSGHTPAVFSALGVAGPAAGITVAAGDGQTAAAGTPVEVPPAVRVTDDYGNPVAGVEVSFAVTVGGGSVSGALQTTDPDGRAAVTGWTLGSDGGANALTATASGSGIGGNPVAFEATGTAGSGPLFDIEIRYNAGSSPTASQRDAFVRAEARWEAIITGDLPDTPLDRPAGTCTSPDPIRETIDDLVIFVTLEEIDGPGGTLGSAGPCLVRAGSILSLMGQMRFDIADLASLESNGLLDEVIVHEMGHVLGIGTLWSAHGLLQDPVYAGGTDPYFTGERAVSAFDAVGGDGYAGRKVPVEDTGGPGTADGHWRESVFTSEVMTGYLDHGTNPLSAVTIESLGDMGYLVDPGRADAYDLSASASLVPGRGHPRAPLHLAGDIWRVPVEAVSPTGRTVGLIPR